MNDWLEGILAAAVWGIVLGCWMTWHERRQEREKQKGKRDHADGVGDHHETREAMKEPATHMTQQE